MTDYVDPDDIADDVGDVLEGNATLVVPMITTMAKAYTRSHGFFGNEPNTEIAAVITAAAARFISNPSQISRSQTAGPFADDVRGGFNGWTLAEQFVLNRYRTRAM
jgi:hypothetical protein